jgi:hypothetical protein
MVSEEIVTTDDLTIAQNLGRRAKKEKPRRKTGPTRAVSPGQLSFMQTLVAEKCGGSPDEVDISLWEDISVKEASGLIESLIQGNKKSTTKSLAGPPASEKQISFVKSLIEQKGATDIEVEGLTKAGASEAIEDLLARPNAAPPKDAVTVPAGRYAIDTEEGHTAFYRVDRPEEGKWAGFTFVKLQVGGDYQRLNQATGKAILKKIEEAGPKEAAIRYGHELGQCAVCGRELTNEDSREAGIGPICAQNF